ncbi:MAG TPA: response regulator [Verrucomicrobiae bacterium]|nr:response regulator [Verrucomicrobiae bacterium]
MPISLHLVNKAEKPTGKTPRRALPKEKEKDAFSTEAPSPSPPAPIGNNRRVLVVDDNAVVLKAFELKLRADGFAVTTTTNSSAVASTAEQTQTELIVLDVNFPTGGAMEWNGFTVMQWLHRFPELQRIPVILISGSEAAEYKNRALAAGAIAFFQKPVNYQEILEAMLKALGEKPAQPTK